MSAPLPRHDRPARQTVDWRRRDAAYRLPRRNCGCPHAFHSDPLDCLAAAPGPSTFSLAADADTEDYVPVNPADELAAEVRRCRALGWGEWELAERFDLAAVRTAA